MTLIVGTEMAVYDRASFDWWYPDHLREVLACVDRLYLRIDPDTLEQVVAVIRRHFPDELDDGRIDYEPQRTDGPHRFQEDAERQALLEWASAQQADWQVAFDADEVLEPGGGAALRALLSSPAAHTFRLLRVVLTYCSHHRPGFVLPRGGFMPYRAWRLDRLAAGYRYQADEDGLHSGTAPFPGVGCATLPELRCIHYHATSCAEYMGERAFYSGTAHVDEWGGVDFLYRCDRFGDERLAVPLEQELAGAGERLARVAAGEGLIR